jgi:hypothetical protein
MDIDFNALASIIGIFSVVSAIAALLLESRRSRITLQSNLLLKLDEKFYSPEILKLRQAAATKLLNEKYLNYELDKLLDAYTTVAMLIECKAIDMDLAYRIFEYDIVRYWLSAEKHIKENRCIDSELWLTLERTVKKLMAERRKRGQPHPTKEELVRFLKEEACCE